MAHEVGTVTIKLTDVELNHAITSLEIYTTLDLPVDNEYLKPYHELKGDGQLKETVITDVPDVQIFDKISEPNKIVPCVQSMLKQGAVQGKRHVTAMRIIKDMESPVIMPRYVYYIGIIKA